QAAVGADDLFDDGDVRSGCLAAAPRRCDRRRTDPPVDLLRIGIDCHLGEHGAADNSGRFITKPRPAVPVKNMCQKRREQKRLQRMGGESAIRWAAVLRAIVLGGGMALIVIGTMVPSESAISDGAHAPMVAGWCLLLVVWAAAMWLDDQRTMRLG